MSVTVRAATPVMDGTSSQTGSWTWAVPAAAQAGDVALVAIGGNTGAATMPTPAGWSLLDGPKYLTSNLGAYLFGKVLAAGDLGGSVGSTWTVGLRNHGGGILLAGAAGLPVAGAIVYWSDGTDGASVQADAVTTIDANSMVVDLGMFRSPITTQLGLITVDGAYSVDARGRTNFGTSPNFEGVVSHKTALVTVGGTSTAGTLFTAAGADQIRGHGWTIAVSPASVPLPNASFTAAPVSGQAPLAVSFTDTSTGTPTSWSWDFGDGQTSNAQSPTHTYTTPSTYTVTLNVSNSAGADPTPATASITVSGDSGYKFYKLRGGLYVPASILRLSGGVYS